MKKLFIITACMYVSLYSFGQIQKGTIKLGGSIGLGGSTESNQYQRTNTASSANNYADPKEKNSDISISLNPSIGYFVSDKLEIGITSNFMRRNSIINDNYINNNNGEYEVVKLKNKNSNYGIGIYASRYKSLSEKVFFSIITSLSYSKSISTNESFNQLPNNASDYETIIYNGNNYQNSSISARMGASLFILPSPKWGLALSFGNLISLSKNFSMSKYRSLGGSVENQTINQSIYKWHNSYINFGLSSFSPSIGFYYLINKK